MFSPSRDLGAC